MPTIELTDEELALLHLLVRNHTAVARANSRDELLRPEERALYDRRFRLCDSLLSKVETIRKGRPT